MKYLQYKLKEKANIKVWSLFMKNILFLFIFLSVTQAEGKLNVLTSTMNLKSLTENIAEDRIHLESIIKGPQDPHFLSPKPSYMLKARKADLLVLIGMELEIGWLPGIIHGARNPHIQKGKEAYLDVSRFIKALSIPEGKVNRFFGDIHPFGNPHYLLDPLRAVQVSGGISQKLSLLDQENADFYIKNQEQLERNIKEKMKLWRKRIKDSGVKKIVTYHSSFEYFLDQFQLELVGLIEEKPGIPPSVKHILQLIQKMKDGQCSCILMSSFYGNERAKKIQKVIPVHIETVAIEVMALEKIKDYFLVMEGVVQAIENCGNFNKDRKGKS